MVHLMNAKQCLWATGLSEQAASVHIHCHPFITIQPKSWYSLYHPSEGRGPCWPTYWDGYPAHRDSHQSKY